METRHEGCMGPRPRSRRYVHWQLDEDRVLLDEVDRLRPEQPRTWWIPPPPPTSYAIPKRNYYRKYLERRGNVTSADGWLGLNLGPYDINELHNLVQRMDMINARRRDSL